MFGRKKERQPDEFEIIKTDIKNSIKDQIPDDTFPVKTKLKFNLEHDTSMIELTYSQERRANLKQLIKKKKQFSEEDLKQSRFKKNLKLYELEIIESELIPIMIDSNILKMQIDTTTFSKVSSMVSGGNFDFGDDFTRGYTLTVSQSERDTELMKYVVKFLQNLGWGCLYGEKSTHCHLQNDFPNTDDAIKILEDISTRINEDLSLNGLRISIRK